MSRRIARSALGMLLLSACALASDIEGIWVGQQPGRRGEAEDLAFRFKLNGDSVTGKMFGDEFDLPISEGSISGDQIRFTVTTTNYYNGSKTKFTYTGTIKDGVLELVRERVQGPDDRGAKGANRPAAGQVLKLKRISGRV
jgi:hypothetical protein